jgi:hypothetical protein
LLVHRRHSRQRGVHRLVSRVAEAFLTKVHLRKASLVAARRRMPLDGAHFGERWAVRYWLTGGSATDVIGWIESMDAATVRLATPDSTTHLIQRSMIIAARRAPAAAGGPDPRRISAHDVQRHTVRGWKLRLRNRRYGILAGSAAISRHWFWSSDWPSSCLAGRLIRPCKYGRLWRRTGRLHISAVGRTRPTLGLSG